MRTQAKECGRARTQVEMTHRGLLSSRTVVHLHYFKSVNLLWCLPCMPQVRLSYLSSKSQLKKKKNEDYSMWPHWQEGQRNPASPTGMSLGLLKGEVEV